MHGIIPNRCLLLHYLEENWAGIVNSAGAKRLGTIDVQIQHNIARWMKRIGAKWTTAGGDRMARILAAKAKVSRREKFSM